MNSANRMRMCSGPVRRAGFRCTNWSCLWTWRCGWTPARSLTGYTFILRDSQRSKNKNAFLGFRTAHWTFWIKKCHFLFLLRIGENNPPFSFAIFSNPEEGTLNASTDLDSNGSFCQQVRLHLQTNGLADLAALVDLVSSFRLWIHRLLPGSQQRTFLAMWRIFHSPTAAPCLPTVTVRIFFPLLLLPLVHLFHLLPKIMIIVVMIIMKTIMIKIILIVINVCTNILVVMMLISVCCIVM